MKRQISRAVKIRKKRAPLLYALGFAFLAILFFSNDFGLLDIQKTAIVLAVGIDRENEDFVVTSQIAVPSASSEQKGSAEAIQVTTRGETVASAIQKVNEKTGWYPKLVFCNLIVLGESATQKNVFEALDFFLRNDYISDNCNVCCCDGKAETLLSRPASTESISSIAIGKILSDHSAFVATAAPVSLHSFAKEHFRDCGGFMPIVSAASLSETMPESDEENEEKNKASNQNKNAEKNGQNTPSPDKKEQNQSFSAAETALFCGGVRKGKLTHEETFALRCFKGGVRLASFNTEYGGAKYTLLVKKNSTKIDFSVSKTTVPTLRVSLSIKAGLSDLSLSQTVTEIAAPEKTEREVLARAEEKLLRLIRSAFEKSRAVGCDVFNVRDRLQKYESAYFSAYKENILERLLFYADVKFLPTR